ncbi:MAG: tRNA (pseudouridine(54)-N(1))-methyltransferase TrmY [Methanobacteriota archaeon]|nr:MAG: tRNA (pseudouridine(54)-N(1))-methyltransferase TrmY [Euryarchaeota archaeon]
MRRFLVVGHRASTSPEFPLDDLAGGAGRMDLLLTAANAALLVAHDVRRDSEAILLLLGPPDPPRAVRLVGDRLQSYGPDIRGNAGLIRKALFHGSRLERETSPGVFASRRGLPEVLEAIPEPVVHLREDGKDIREVELPRDVAFVLSDSADLSGEEEAVVARRRIAVGAVGPRSLHTSDTIAIVHNELDRRHRG